MAIEVGQPIVAADVVTQQYASASKSAILQSSSNVAKTRTERNYIPMPPGHQIDLTVAIVAPFPASNIKTYVRDVGSEDLTLLSTYSGISSDNAIYTNTERVFKELMIEFNLETDISESQYSVSGSFEGLSSVTGGATGIAKQGSRVRVLSKDLLGFLTENTVVVTKALYDQGRINYED